MIKRTGILFVACLMAAACAHGAESFKQRLEKANAMLNGGNADGALNQYRNLQTDDPESPVLYYNIGRAHYQEAIQFGQLGSTKDAVASLEKAREAFKKVEAAPSASLREDAAYNHATCIAQQAKISAEGMKSGKAEYEATVKAFEESVKEYEAFLKKHPDHAAARQNLDHMRYLLKSMLQNPPPPQEQQQQQDQKQDDQKKDQEKSDDQQQQQQSDQQQQQQDEQQDQQQDQQQAEQEEKGEEQKQAEQQQQQQAQAQQNQEQPQQQQAGENNQQPQGNVEALLESLEEMDEREQRELKNQRQRGNPVQGNWW